MKDANPRNERDTKEISFLLNIYEISNFTDYLTWRNSCVRLLYQYWYFHIHWIVQLAAGCSTVRQVTLTCRDIVENERKFDFFLPLSERRSRETFTFSDTLSGEVIQVYQKSKTSGENRRRMEKSHMIKWRNELVVIFIIIYAARLAVFSQTLRFGERAKIKKRHLTKWHSPVGTKCGIIFHERLTFLIISLLVSLVSVLPSTVNLDLVLSDIHFLFSSIFKRRWHHEKKFFSIPREWSWVVIDVQRSFDGAIAKPYGTWCDAYLFSFDHLFFSDFDAMRNERKSCPI